MLKYIFREAAGNIRALDKLIQLPQLINESVVAQVDRNNLALLRDSKTVPPRVPLDTGALQSTGRAIPATISSEGIIHGELTYGGWSDEFSVDVDYAVTTHEWEGRQYKRPGAGAKYVEAHVRRRSQEMFNAIGRAIKEAARK